MLRRSVFVGVAGFEPATSCSQSRRDNRATLHPEKGGKNNQKCMRNLLDANAKKSLNAPCTFHQIPLDPLMWLRPFFSCSQTSLGRGLPDLRSGIPWVETVHRPWIHSRGSGPSFPAPKQAWGLPDLQSGIPWVETVHRPWIHSRGSGPSFPAPKQAWAGGIAPDLQSGIPWVETVHRPWIHSRGSGPSFPAPKQAWAGKQKTLTALLSGPVDCGERGIRTPGTVTRTAV